MMSAARSPRWIRMASAFEQGRVHLDIGQWVEGLAADVLFHAVQNDNLLQGTIRSLRIHRMFPLPGHRRSKF